jgi:hypothetical protein
MESKTNSRTKARFLVIAVFAIGFAAGALSMNLYSRLTTAGKETDRRPAPEAIVDRLDKALKLSHDQHNEIKSILDDTFNQFKEERDRLQPLYKQIEPHFTEIRQRSRDRIRAILDEQQLPKFEELVRNEDRKREEYRQGQRK